MSLGIVSTIGQKCKRCYSCVRECPARAIKVIDGQAFVMDERCINCGYCVKVCSQDAKRVQSDIEKVFTELIPNNETYAIVAPSFPASFDENHSKVPAILRSLGFSRVIETAFGADMVSKYYAELFDNNKNKTIITTPCPAVYNLIQMYHPEIVENLAEVVSPMIALGRYLKTTFGKDKKVVFIGPCVAKKDEYQDSEVKDSIDAVITFKEIKEHINNHVIDINSMPIESFDPPHGYLGKSYSLTGGLTKTSNLNGDILEKDVIVVEGKARVLELIDEITAGRLQSKFVDILFCEGCINGPAMDTDLNYYSRREKVINYLHSNINSFDKNIWKSNLFSSRNIPLTRKFENKSQRRPMPSEDEIKQILARTEKYNRADELNCGSCGYPTCREYAIAIAKDLAEDDMCLPFLIEKLEHAYGELKDTQEQLHNAEKLASIGQLAAGVAHEINNPLGSIILFASMLRKNIEKCSAEPQNQDDLKLIIDEANRCKNIVSNLLNFARQGKLRLQSISLNDLVQKVLKGFRINPLYKDYVYDIFDDVPESTIEADSDQLKQVFINLISNASEALENASDKRVEIRIKHNSHDVVIEITDYGCGIADHNINKIFTPFFTTKKIGRGTGLGLAIVYGIIKMHRGDITVKSTIDKGTTFTIKLPLTLNVQKMFIN